MSSAFTFLSDVEEFENQTGEDAPALFANITALLCDNQLRAHTAEAYE